MGYPNWSSQNIFNPRRQSRLFDDFVGWKKATSDFVGETGMVANGAAGGGITSAVNAESGRLGLATFGLGTTNNATAVGGVFGDLTSLFAGTGEIILEWSVKTPDTLSDVTNEYVLEMGFSDTISAGAATDGIVIQYKRTASVNWSAYTANNGTVTTVTTEDSALAVATSTWYHFRIHVPASGTPVSFYVNGKLLGTSATNIPSSAARQTCLNFIIYRAATFALTRTFSIDWYKLDVNYTENR